MAGMSILGPIAGMYPALFPVRRPAINFCAILFILCLCSFSCSTSKPVRLHAHMSVRDYAAFASKTPTTGNHPEQLARVIMTYPILEVFAPDGRLVFQGDNISENLALLRQTEI